MRKLIILSDLWGRLRTDWLSLYILPLSRCFEVVYYDCRELANIPLGCKEQESLHQLFMSGGADNAVAQLLRLEHVSDTILGFSVGGYIAWKACLQGLNTQRLFAVSSTRLRDETAKPPIEIELFYGQNDRFSPNKKWFEKMKLQQCCYPFEEHEMYWKPEIAQDICNRIIKNRL